MKSIVFYGVSQLSAIALMHGIRRNGVPSLFVSQNSRYVCSETGFDAHYFEGDLGMCAAKRGSKHFDYHNIVTVCSETGFKANGF